MQPGVKWFQGPSGAAFKFQCGPRGIHIPGLAAEVQLKERPLKLNGVVVDFDEHGNVSLKEAEELIGQRGASEDNSIQVTGQPAGPSSSAGTMSEPELLQTLLHFYKSRVIQRLKRPCPLIKRRTPVNPSNDILEGLGEYFPLVGFEHVVDDVIRLFCHLCRKFRPDNPRFLEGLQLLRVVGAPGTGKSTLLLSVWPLLVARLQQVKAEGGSLWQKWLSLGVEELLERLNSWQEGLLVFGLDMSRSGLIEREPGVTGASVSLALKMLYAMAPASASQTYDAFLIEIASSIPGIKEMLLPHHVLQLLREALFSAYSPMKPVIAVWYFDEVNAAGINELQATYMQEQLSAAVQARLTAVEQFKDGYQNVLPVFVTGSTRGTASSLQHTTSKKSKIKDVRLAMVTEHNKCLMVMDLFRRLPLPDDLRTELELPSREGSFDGLSAAEQDKLLEVCPKEISSVLRWLGGLLRLSEYAVASLSGTLADKGSAALTLKVDGVVSLLRKQWPRKPDEVIKDLATYQFDPKWKSYWEPKTGSWELMSVVFAHALSGRPVSRTQCLAEVEDKDVTVQNLESDGMIWLELAGEAVKLEPSSRPLRTSSDSDDSQGIQGIQPVAATDMAGGAAPQQVEGEPGQTHPDTVQQWCIMVPALLLVAAQRRLPTRGEPYVRVPLLSSLADEWRDREESDLLTLALRLQVHLEGFQERTVLLRDLHPFLGLDDGIRVLVPTQGYGVVLHSCKVDEQSFETMIDAATLESGWLHLGPGNGGPADSWVVLLECSDQGEPTGRKVVTNLQSKSGKQDKALNHLQLDMEVKKVPDLSGRDDLVQAFLYVSNQKPGRVFKKPRLTATSDHSSSMHQQTYAFPVSAVLRDQQHVFRAASQLVKLLCEAFKQGS